MRDVMDTLRVDALHREPGAEGDGPQREPGAEGDGPQREPGAVLRPRPALRSVRPAVPSEAVLQEVPLSRYPVFVFLPCLDHFKDPVKPLEDLWWLATRNLARGGPPNTSLLRFI